MQLESNLIMRATAILGQQQRSSAYASDKWHAYCPGSMRSLVLELLLTFVVLLASYYFSSRSCQHLKLIDLD